MGDSDKPNNDTRGSFWTTLPGILGGLAGLVVAVTGLIAGLSQAGLLKIDSSSPTPTSSSLVEQLSTPTSSESSPVENNPVERVPTQDAFDAEAIHDKITQGNVLFHRGNEVFRGQITSSEIRKRQNLEESGVVARIDWNDGEISTILFMENSKVRVWSNEQEYGGSWFWDSNGLISVNMDAGSKYQFGR